MRNIDGKHKGAHHEKETQLVCDHRAIHSWVMSPRLPRRDSAGSGLSGNVETVRLSQFNGQPVVLSLGATWCPDCRAEAPVLEELHQAHPELVVLMVDSKESFQTVQLFAEEFGLTHRILLDRDGAVGDLYQVFAIPTVLFIDAEGVIRAKVIEGVTPQLLAEKLPLIGITP
jgi:thiol-disulfide isomerase/thioredoxin